MKENRYTILGIMSGTSLDGVDIALCSFSYGEQWKYEIVDSVTVPYSFEMKKELSLAHNLDTESLFHLDARLGNYFGVLAKTFLNGRSVDFISSHGHTVFHNPAMGFSVQIGKGAHLAETSGFDVVCDFRSNDVAMGGQGAPLVPVGDELLFSEYSYCLNLGGIANISFNNNGKRTAFDCCFCNMAINHLTSYLGLEMDLDGNIAQKGEVDPELLQRLNAANEKYLLRKQSLGKEIFSLDFEPFLQNQQIENKLRTVVEYIAFQVSNHIKEGSCLVTGGGTYNRYLMELISQKSSGEIIIPDKNIVEFKEALIFAFLGLLRWQNLPNSMSNVTGAKKNAIGGAIYKAS
ncbi:MAG: anhydro-N-acetylmuramic acid kinase [Flavobacteriales bacterium]